MRPEAGVSKPASMRSRVVWPQPDEPSSAKISPLAMSTLTWLTATEPPPKSLTTSSMRRNAESFKAAMFGCCSDAGLERGVHPGHRAPHVVGHRLGQRHLLHLRIGR